MAHFRCSYSLQTSISLKSTVILFLTYFQYGGYLGPLRYFARFGEESLSFSSGLFAFDNMFCSSMKTPQNIQILLCVDAPSRRLAMPLVARDNGAGRDAAVGMG